MAKKILGVLLALPVLVSAVGVLAAPDTDIVSNSTAMVDSAKENIFGVITANIGTITLVFIGLLAVFLVFKLIRRSVGR